MYVQRSSRARFTVLVLACLGLLSAGVAGAQQVAVDFGSIPRGGGVEGLGRAHPDLNIGSKRNGTAVRMLPNSQPVGYGAPNPECNQQKVFNGCLDPNSGFGFAGGNGGNMNFNFSFSPGTTVKQFSVRMLDYGDWNPSASANHMAQLTAYDANGAVVATHVLNYTSAPEQNPRTSDYGDLGCGSGDGCMAQPGQPGNWTWSAEGRGIVRLELRSIEGLDDWIAFDSLTFTKETAQDKTGYLVESVQSLGLQQGMYTSLTAKLQDALTALVAGDTVTAATALQDFINQVSAQTGKKIDPTTAAQLTDDATAILQLIAGT